MARYEDSTGQRLFGLVSPESLVGSGNGKIGLKLLAALAEANPRLFVAESLDLTSTDGEVASMRQRLIELNSVFAMLIGVAKWEHEVTQAATARVGNPEMTSAEAAAV